MEHNKHAHGARNFFLFFLAFVMLYIIAINFGGLLFDLIDKAFGEPGSFRSFVAPESLRFHIASLIIGTPIFLYLSGKLYREAKHSSELKHSALRRWLTYITLLATTLVVVGDLIALVFHLLGGDTTTQFILKALAVLIIAAAILYYYLQDLKNIRREGKSAIPQLTRVYFIVTILAVGVGIVIGFFSIGSPAQQRQVNNDQKREQNLQEIERSMQQYYFVQETLPESLDELEIRTTALTDPITGKAVPYTKLSDTNYTICAVFETSTKDDVEPYTFSAPFVHGAGETCFERAVTKGVQGTPDIIRPLPIE